MRRACMKADITEMLIKSQNKSLWQRCIPASRANNQGHERLPDAQSTKDTFICVREQTERCLRPERAHT